MEKPLLQIALDTYDLPSALGPLQKAAAHIDVIEVGTILCLAEGMHAVRAIKSLFPDKIVLADVRIAEAGSIISKMCFDAGADWVSVVSGAAPSSFEVVLAEALSRSKDMQIELSDGWTWEMAQRWADMGIRQVIFKRSRDLEAQGKLNWGERDFDTIRRLHEMGFKVTVTGGVKPKDISLFAGVPVYIFIAGRAILGADDPAAAVQAFQAAITETYG
ncbi:MAG: 3-dehydro-L-gulonate-6-phosphate decarboxylase [Ardenticatenaceae bacterium]|nr:3-dehydro-L-gulonate-6-phosphate decarboxylase [Ardenticatenaceae bacterium]MCB9442597.1 3-dehydro-L-gulonate-6-phosphate decarboxylase [Ardenticatenaceae bacterium]